jgi:glucose/arabinose dehydrogenase
VRDGRGAGAYIHPAGLEVEGGLGYEIIDSTLQLPSALTHSPDGRVFVADFATGTIWVYADSNGAWDRSVFARWPAIQGAVPAAGSSEAGLWGLAFDPAGGWLYAMGIERWSPQPGPGGRARGLSRILRFEDAAGGEPDWELVLGDLPAGMLHSGGALTFGPHGDLYASVGDGGHGGPGRQELVGTILRLSPSGARSEFPPAQGEATRSLPAQGEAPRSLVYARGLRNPYGLDFGADGLLYATENGPDCCDRLLRVVEGADFGWAASEGPVDLEILASNPSLSAPLWDSGPSRIGPTGLVAGEGTLHFVTWHTAALHALELDSVGGVGAHVIRFDGATARPPEASVYRFSGGFTGLSRGPDGRLWFTAAGALGRFSL